MIEGLLLATMDFVNEENFFAMSTRYVSTEARKVRTKGCILGHRYDPDVLWGAPV